MTRSLLHALLLFDFATGKRKGRYRLKMRKRRSSFRLLRKEPAPYRRQRETLDGRLNSLRFLPSPSARKTFFLSAKLTCFFGPFFAPHSSPFKMDDGGYTAGRGVLGGGVGVGGCVGGGKETSSLVRSSSRGGVPRSAAAAARAGACIGGGRPRSRGESRL